MPQESGPAQPISFKCQVVDTGHSKSEYKAEPYKFNYEMTVSATMTVEDVKATLVGHIGEMGWKSEHFQSVIMVGPIKLDGSLRQVGVLGTKKGGNKKIFMSSSRKIGFWNR